MEKITIYKKQYNKLLEREKKAEKYLDDDSIPLEEREKWIPEFQKILMQINLLLKHIGPHTHDEAVHGFKEE